MEKKCNHDFWATRDYYDSHSGDDPAANPRAERFSLWHSPPAEGVVAFDELAMVSWEEGFDLTAGHAFATLHIRDFLRIIAQPGRHTVAQAFHNGIRLIEVVQYFL